MEKEEDDASTRRLEECQKELADIEEKLQPLRDRYEQERGAVTELAEVGLVLVLLLILAITLILILTPIL